MAKLQAQGTFSSAHGKATFGLSVVAFYKDETFMVYAPALDLYGYGKTESEARQSFRVVLEEFLRYTGNKNTLEEELKSLGWKVEKQGMLFTATAPDFKDLVMQNEELQEILELNDIRKYHEEIELQELVA